LILAKEDENSLAWRLVRFADNPGHVTSDGGSWNRNIFSS
jgi:hypothetical protein